MVFSTNQARQLYVVTATTTEALTSKSAVGTLFTPECVTKQAEQLWFALKGKGGIVRTDLIDVDKIISINQRDAWRKTLKSAKITLSSQVNGGTPIAGQDYILRIFFRQFVGISDEDTYIKYGMVHAYSGMSASTFYLKLAESLYKNLSRDISDLLNVSLLSSDGEVKLDVDTKFSDLYDDNSAAKATYTGVKLTEAMQEWTRGIKADTPVYFDVIPTTVYLNGDELIWGTVTTDTELAKDADGNEIFNGHDAADLEYFCMGERGDQYRNVCWPHVIPTEYMVDPNGQYGVLDIHYYTDEDNQSPQKSEKTLTLLIDENSKGIATDIYGTLKTTYPNLKYYFRQ
jgi:hypothetical protein